MALMSASVAATAAALSSFDELGLKDADVLSVHARMVRNVR